MTSELLQTIVIAVVTNGRSLADVRFLGGDFDEMALAHC